MSKICLEIKKALLAGLHNVDYPITQAIQDIVNEFLFLYETTKSERYIITASQYILGYLQLGGSYLENKALFDFVLKKANYSEQDIHKLQLKNPKIHLKKNNIRSIIGRWTTSIYNSHTISDVVNDIIFRVENDDFGVYEYFTANKDGNYTALYQLTVCPGYALFHNVNQNKFYQLVKK